MIRLRFQQNRRGFLRAIAIVCSTTACAAFGQPAVAPTPPTIVDIGSSFYDFERLQLTSVDGERHYRVYIARPKRQPPPNGYPVIYLLDGNAALMALSEAQLETLDAGGVPPVIVAIGYEISSRLDITARTYDYTPPLSATEPTLDDSGGGRRAGGADVFLDFLEERIKPAVETRAPIDRQQQTLWGHSYGGLFVLHALFLRPGTFQRYAAGDPSLWWHDGFIVKQEEKLPFALPNDGLRLLLMVGVPAAPAEQSRPEAAARADTGQRRPRRVISPTIARTLVERLNRRQRLQAEFEQVDGASHAEMLAISLERTLAWK